MKKKLGGVMLAAFLVIGIGANLNISSNRSNQAHVTISEVSKSHIHTDVIGSVW